MLALHVRAPGFYPSIRKRRKRKKKSSCSLTHLKMFYALTGLSPESFLLGSHCCHLLFSWWDLWLQEAIKTQPALEKAAENGQARSSENGQPGLVSVSKWTRRAGITQSTRNTESCPSARSQGVECFTDLRRLKSFPICSQKS